MNVFEILNKRSQFEDIVQNYRIPGSRKSGTIQNLKWFVKHSASKNSKFPDFDDAFNIAKDIVENEARRKAK